MKSYKNNLLIRIISVNILICLFSTSFAFGNSAPILIEENPSFTIAPIDDSPIEVLREYLQFDMSEGTGDTAKVRATYEMMNTSDVGLKQNMIFPFITSPYNNFTKNVNISANGIPIDFKTIRLKELPDRNFRSLQYLGESNRIKELIDINSIINMINITNNSTDLSPKNISLKDMVKVYTIHLPKVDERYKAEVYFESLHTEKQMLLYFNFNSFELNNKGIGKLGTWSGMKSIPSDYDKAIITILGDLEEDVIINSVTNQEISVVEKSLEQFLLDLIDLHLISLENYDHDMSSYIYEDYNKDLLNHLVKQIDNRFDRKEPFLSIDGDGISSFNFETYLGAFIYAIDFEPNDVVNVTIEYEMLATSDRRTTLDFSKMFLYLLNPASKWKDFGELKIEVIPNENYPFVISSSLPLLKNSETGIYTNSFEGLPEEDFYFVTYKTKKPEPPIIRALRILPYILYFIFPFIVILLICLVLLLYFKKVKKYNNINKK